MYKINIQEHKAGLWKLIFVNHGAGTEFQLVTPRHENILYYCFCDRLVRRYKMFNKETMNVSSKEA